MKAAYYDRQGNAREVLAIGEVETPRPGPSEVSVVIHVSGVNPTDIKARIGFSATMPHPRIIPHQDGAGIIDAIGDGVSPDRLGERVWVLRHSPGGPAELPQNMWWFPLQMPFHCRIMFRLKLAQAWEFPP